MEWQRRKEGVSDDRFPGRRSGPYALDLVGQDHRILAQIPIHIGDQAQLPLEPLDLPYPQVGGQQRDATQDRRRRCQSESRPGVFT